MSRLLPIRRRPYTTAIRDCGVQLKWFSRSNSFFRPMKFILRQYRPIFDYNPAYSDFTGGYGPDSACYLRTGPARSYDMALPSFVEHLKVLEQSGLVRSHKAGRVRTY